MVEIELYPHKENKSATMKVSTFVGHFAKEIVSLKRLYELHQVVAVTINEIEGKSMTANIATIQQEES